MVSARAAQVDEKEVYSALVGGDPHDQLAVAYHLIIDNRRIKDPSAPGGRMEDFYVAQVAQTGPASSLAADLANIPQPTTGSGLHLHFSMLSRSLFPYRSIF